MKIGIPKGLLYYKYYPFIQTFFTELGAEIVISPDTNKDILDDGVKYCVDDACVPIKIFHGHVVALKDKCDMIFIPRIMELRKQEFICPKFCGLTEMIINDIPDLPVLLGEPIYATTRKGLKKWAVKTGRSITKNRIKINKALKLALEAQEKYKTLLNNEGLQFKVALVGHPYNIYDVFLNMNLVKKLNKLGIGVITEEFVDEAQINLSVSKLFKKPFWTFARNSYGFSTYLSENNEVDGIIYISSFSCGIDSVVVELIKDKIKDFPMLILKIDEHTGEAGFDTRLEAFSDMLERRCVEYENNLS
ncbi:MAG: 2-hydroxyglutaryl-CoA dehydratase [Clostridiaceae bacterium]|nr:2-hydroxyglutaryl-CoA dehydratase [Clostridiaceae bacterium]